MQPETAGLFSFHELQPTGNERALLAHLLPHTPVAVLDALACLSSELSKVPTAAKHQGSGLQLTLRHLIRLARRLAAHPRDFDKVVTRTLLAPFLPPALRDSLCRLVAHVQSQVPAIGVQEQDEVGMGQAAVAGITVHHGQGGLGGRVTFGDVTLEREHPQNPALVPNVVFFDIPRHREVLQELAKDFECGDRHLLLIGNQGVGKNKLVDRFLGLLQQEREYIQLHRDTSVQSLTVSTSLENGVVTYNDSPLVRACKEGRVLMVDEADKAPLQVVCILKGLLEDGQMILSDGRRLETIEGAAARRGEQAETAACNDTIIPIHPKFRAIVLANRPGFPFLGDCMISVPLVLVFLFLRFRLIGACLWPKTMPDVAPPPLGSRDPWFFRACLIVEPAQLEAVIYMSRRASPTRYQHTDMPPIIIRQRFLCRVR